jgi:hypothetical protein
MDRNAALLCIAAVVILALSLGDAQGMLRSIEHGIGWGIGREITHAAFHYAR